MADVCIYPERESKTLEFKSTVKKFDNIIRTAIAFANGVGGKIVIGIEDDTRKIIGINDKQRDRIYDDFPNSLYDLTQPHLIPLIYEQRFAEYGVIVIEIPPVLKKPCCHKNKGIPKGVYFRIGTSTRPASEEQIEELMRENQRYTFDEESIPIGLDELSNELLVTYYKKKSKQTLLEDKIIKRSVVNHENYHPTVAGLLLFSNKPDRHIHEALVKCTRFSGTGGRDIIQTEEIAGPIGKQIDIAFNLVSSWLKRKYRLEGVKMISGQLVPDAALREVITNAVIHRKYTIPGAVKIALYDDRLEIFSPGNFPGHVSIDNLGDGITHLRNPALARMAHKIGLIEKLGSGIKLIFDSCAENKTAAPIYSEDGDYVKVIFNFLPCKMESEPDEERVLALLKIKESITIHDMIEHLNRSKNTVFKTLNKLIDEKRIKRIGKGRATRYVLTR